MMKPIPYIFIAVAVVISILFDIPSLYLVVKPLLMPTLLLYFLSESRGCFPDDG